MRGVLVASFGTTAADTLPETIGAGNIKKTALIIVGDCMGDKYLRSRLYSPDFSTEFRKGTDDAAET